MKYFLYKLLKDKKVADSYQFYTSCEYKLYFAETNLKALQNIIKKYQKTEAKREKEFFRDVVMTGEGKYIIHDDNINYLGVKMNMTSVIDKLTMEMMGLLHNFFDTYAQWLNSVLFGEEALPIKKVSLLKVVQKLSSYPEYASTFVTKLSAIPNEDQYLYIVDFNNTLKHRYQIYVTNKFNIFSMSGNVSIPEFKKDGRAQLKNDALDILKKSLDYCRELLDDSRNFVEQYFSKNDNNYVEHRIYNPKTYLLFKTEEDYKNMRSPKNHYYFVEVDSDNIPDKLQIMLCYDRMNHTNYDEQTLECYNSPYELIIMREKGGHEIIGILKPDDKEVYELNDEHELKYRQYISVTKGYEYEMMLFVAGKENFKYFGLLSELTIAYETKKE